MVRVLLLGLGTMGQYKCPSKPLPRDSRSRFPAREGPAQIHLCARVQAERPKAGSAPAAPVAQSRSSYPLYMMPGAPPGSDGGLSMRGLSYPRGILIHPFCFKRGVFHLYDFLK